ncbi:hypothetical protein [Asticcacaulis sp. EMRT-3]|uniref:hypothetical protein n=1 Tax=Asticcacaulis sp. EMRT-3 TaxID=3040349 RepID=UPI0024AFACD6|nr:hypothetical protein [Asticcacaulis sp. EMRT-3]MDI7774231.1 hypothetical protein [Asticcacaulis sp. EMRT-3]
MNKKNTPLSITLAITGIGLLLIGIFLLNIAASPLGDFYFLIPMALIYGSLKSMKSVDRAQLPKISKRNMLMRYAAAYFRVAAGLMIIGAIMIYSRNKNLSISQLSFDSIFLIGTSVAFIAAVVLTILSSRLKSEGLSEKQVGRL